MIAAPSVRDIERCRQFPYLDGYNGADRTRERSGFASSQILEVVAPNAVTYIVPPQLNRRNSKQMVLRQRLVLPRRSSRRAGGNENCRHPALFRRVKHLLERFNGRVTMGRLPLALYPFAKSA